MQRSDGRRTGSIAIVRTSCRVFTPSLSSRTPHVMARDVNSRLYVCILKEKMRREENLDRHERCGKKGMGWAHRAKYVAMLACKFRSTGPNDS